MLASQIIFNRKYTKGGEYGFFFDRGTEDVKRHGEKIC